MHPDEALKVAREFDPQITEEDLIPLSGGFSSRAYKITREDSSLVLLTSRPDGVSKTNYGHAYVILHLLQKRQYMHAPEPLWLRADHSAILVRHFSGVPADQFDFDAHALDPLTESIRVIDALLDTRDISRDEYEVAAEAHGVKPLPVESAHDAARLYGEEWFDTVSAHCPDRDISEWLAPRLERSYKLSEHLSTREPIFSHGDPSNPNILIQEDGRFMLIDWDSSRFMTVWADYLIAYTTNLTDFMKPFRAQLISHAASRIGISMKELSEQVDTYREFAEVFDINWAAMMMAKVAIGSAQGELDSFRKIAHERMQRYDASFPLA